MKKVTSLFLMAFLLMASFSYGNVANARENFTDLGSVAWAEDAIYYLNDRGVINGYGNGLFGPGDNITREQAALMLVRELYPNEISSTKLTFADVASNSYYYNAIAVAVDHNLFGGYSADSFKPGNPITRAETAKVLSVAYDLKGSNAIFIDLNEAPWATSFINALASNNITNGYSDNTFKPNNMISRAEFSLLLARILDDRFKPQLENSRTNPAPLGEILEVSVEDWDGYKNYEIGMVDAITDGELAWQMIKDANMFNEPAPEGMKYILAKFYIKFLDGEAEPFSANYLDFDAVSKSGVVYDYASVVVPDPELWIDLYKGGEYVGWAPFLVNEEDEPLIVWNRTYDDEIWFSLK